MTTEAPHDHVCLAYDDPATLEENARAFLTAGSRSGQRIWYIGPAGPPVGVPARHLRLDTTYAEGSAVDPREQAAVFIGAFHDALADGHRGLRVVAEVTPLVRTAAQREAFCRYEHLIDRFMAVHPLSGMCAFRRSALGAGDLDELACLHPTTNVAVPFRMHACRPELGRATLSGELDLASEDALRRTLERTGLHRERGGVVLDATGLRFADHRALQRLDRWATDHDTTLVLRASGDGLGRLAALLELDRLRVEVAR
ncbi:MEDS domain-containing protein [Actinoplanes sp. NPDC051633]|uniref:MEDS domain-containing protein n=1 Tax=Actinoplanes sp. NPDC051633 TaxID=3155670 RepID=UPI003425CF6D